MKTFFQKYTSHLTKNQIRALLLLLFLLVLIRVILFVLNTFSNSQVSAYNEEKTLYYQNIIDSIKQVKQEEENSIKPFNPNFISSEKSYRLNLKKEEFERLQKFRETGKYVNSVQEFQNVTQVSNEWINNYSKYFKFPDWVVNKQSSHHSNYKEQSSLKTIHVSTNDLNKATLEDLKEIKGIGDVLAQRILDTRNDFGGFVSIKQIDFIKNISPEAIRELKKVFKVQSKQISKINVNTASIDQLAQIPYLNYYYAKQIVILRSKQSDPITIEDIKKIKGFPVEKLEIIALYLVF